MTTYINIKEDAYDIITKEQAFDTGYPYEVDKKALKFVSSLKSGDVVYTGYPEEQKVKIVDIYHEPLSIMLAIKGPVVTTGIHHSLYGLFTVECLKTGGLGHVPGRSIINKTKE